MTAGRARVGPVDAPVDLETGDYVCYAGDVPHVFEALAAGTVSIMVMEHV